MNLKLLLKICLYTVLVCAVLFGIGIVILSAFGGNAPSWKSQVEGIASAIAGQPVTIGEMDDARLYPDLLFKGGLIYSESLKDEQGASTSLLIKRLEFSVPFWSNFFGQPVFKVFHLEDAYLFSEKAFVVDVAAFSDEYFPALNFRGRYNTIPYDLHIELDQKIGGYRPKIEGRILGTINELDIMATRRRNPDYVYIADVVMSNGDFDYVGEAFYGADGRIKLELRYDTQLYLRLESDLATTQTNKVMFDIEKVKNKDKAIYDLLTAVCTVFAERNFDILVESDELKLLACPALNISEEGALARDE